MKNSRKIDGVNNFSLVNENYFYDRNNQLFSDSSIILDECYGHFSYDGILYAYCKKDQNWFTKVLGNEWVSLDFAFDKPFMDSKIPLVRSKLDSDNLSWFYFLYDIENRLKFSFSIQSYFFGHPFRKGESLFFADKKSLITNLEIRTETTLWQYSIAELGAEKVSKILGVFGETLVVVCGYSKEIERPNGQKNTYPYEKIIGLNKDTGQLLYELDGYELDGEYKLFGPSSCSLFVYNDGETILHALIGFYLTFDTQTGQTKTLNIDVQAHDRGISAVKSASIDGDGIGFSAYDFKVGGFDSVVGVFNTKTLKIEEHYTYEEANKEGAFFGPGQPKIHGNKIYALDTKNTLHILEREEA